MNHNDKPNFFSKLFSDIKTLLKGKKIVRMTKRRAVFLISMLLVETTLCATSLLTTSYFKSNREISLYDVVSEYKKSENQVPNCVIYNHSILNHSDKIVSHISEFSKEIRNIFYNNVCFDFYQTSWADSYSPCIVDLENEREKEFSLLLWPYSNYKTGEWTYTMPTLARCSHFIPSQNDIFINDEYANHLIKTLGLLENDYSSLLNMELSNISYGFKNTSQNQFTKYSSTYVVKGVIDSASEEYQKYKVMFGDFFVASELLSLPFGNQTYFDIGTDIFNSIKYFKTILDVYDYQFFVQSQSNSNVKSYVFDYRISIFGDFDGENSIVKIDNDPTKYNKKTDMIFDLFSTPEYIVHIISLSLVNIAFLIFSILLVLTIFKNEVTSSYLIVLTNLLAILFGASITLVLHKFAPQFMFMSQRNPISLLFIFAELFVVDFVWFLKKKRGTKNND